MVYVLGSGTCLATTLSTRDILLARGIFLEVRFVRLKGRRVVDRLLFRPRIAFVCILRDLNMVPQQFGIQIYQLSGFTVLN